MPTTSKWRDDPALSSRSMLERYREWLANEARLCAMELYPELPPAEAEGIIPVSGAADFHFPTDGRDWRDIPKPSTRAERVLQAAGALPEDEDLGEDAFAATEFIEWEHKQDEWRPPTNAEWAGAANPYLAITRFSWILLYKSKDELIKALEELGDDDTCALIDDIANARAFFKPFLTVLETAFARTCVAGAAMGAARKRGAGK